MIKRMGVFNALGLRGSMLKVYTLHFAGFALGIRCQKEKYVIARWLGREAPWM
jgi:hypothetical protein